MFSCELGPDLELRLLRPQHAEELFALIEADRDRLRQWLPWVDETKTATDSLAFIQHSSNDYSRTGAFAAGLFSEGKLAGVIGIHDMNANSQSAELGYWIGSGFEGKGFMTRACKAVVDYLFSDLFIERVVIRAATANLRSRAIPERLGFTHEGIQRCAGLAGIGRHDLEVYSLLRPEWEASRQARSV